MGIESFAILASFVGLLLQSIAAYEVPPQIGMQCGSDSDCSAIDKAYCLLKVKNVCGGAGVCMCPKGYTQANAMSPGGAIHRCGKGK